MTSPFPLHDDVARVLDSVQQALSMLMMGASLPYGAPPDLIDGCTEAEANEAAAEALSDVQTMLRLHGHARAGVVLGGAS